MSFNAPKPAPRLLVITLAVALSGCATVSGGWRPERTTLTSDPPAAAVTAEGEAVEIHQSFFHGSTFSSERIFRVLSRTADIGSRNSAPATRWYHSDFGPAAVVSCSSSRP